MTTQFITIALTPESERVIQRHTQRPRKLRKALADALRQGLQETETHIKRDLLSGTYTPGRASGGTSGGTSGGGGRTPVGLRSGSLRQAVTSKLENQVSGFVGVVKGPAARYAATILGKGTTTIRPKKGKYLAIPIADGLTRSGQPRFPGGPRSVKGLKIFMSKKGNLIGFLPTPGSGGKFKRGPNKGKSKGKLLFVFKKSVTITGTDALAKGVNDKRGRIAELLLQGLTGVLKGGAA